MAESLTLWLPMPPNLANGRWHHMQKVQVKKAYWEELTRRRDSRYHLPPALDPVPASARVEVTYHLSGQQKRMDRDNATARLKWILDWLVGNGYLAGDREDQCDLARPRQVRAGSGIPELCTIELVITPLSGDAEEVTMR